ncbi:MAG TPA: hypothetical protein VGL59_21175 [Polyangia bacterium]
MASTAISSLDAALGCSGATFAGKDGFAIFMAATATGGTLAAGGRLSAPKAALFEIAAGAFAWDDPAASFSPRTDAG